MTRNIPFTKMVGTGNDFLIVDTVRHALGSLKTAWPRVARAMCDRRHGVGADGVLVLERSREADARMRVFNPDGSEPEMCGNGARCVASYVRHPGTITIETKAGVVTAAVRGNRVAMRMPDPKGITLSLRLDVDPVIRSLAFLDTGVPHVVASVDHVDRLDVDALGRTLRHHQAFQPRGANVDFIEVNPKAPHHLRIRTYERGVEGETPACGTGAAAAAVIHALRTATTPAQRPTPRHITVETKSGEALAVSLTVENGRRRRQVTDVTLEGAVRRICQGTFAWRTKGSR